MNKNRNSRTAPLVMIAIVVVVAIFALFMLAKSLLDSSSTEAPTKKKETNITTEALLNTATDRSIEMIVRGPLVSQENFRSYRIVVTPVKRTMVVYEGYLGKVLAEKSYDNNAKAYEEMVYALNRMNFMKDTPFDGDKNDMRGVCPKGNILEFKLLNGNNVTKHLWKSTCGDQPGSYKGNTNEPAELIRNQINDFSELKPKTGSLGKSDLF